MPVRIGNRLKFFLERLLLRGAHYRLLLIAALLGLLSVLGGAMVYYAGGGFEDLSDAVWWAFLRLSDPGYLGDDQGPLRRTVSTALTILGYVIFLGSLVAIMTQWLNATIRRLESGLTPIGQRDHVLILGWTTRTAGVVRELAQAQGRVRRFLQRRSTRSLRVVILAEDVSTELNQELRERLGRYWHERQVVLRSGTPLRLDHLRRVEYRHAAAIVLPASDPEPGDAEPDARTIKTLLSIATHAGVHAEQILPYTVAEIIDERKVDVALRAYPGHLEVLGSGSIIGRLIAQNVRHPGLSHLYAELFSYGRGSEMYVREIPGLVGTRVQDLVDVFPRAIVLGVVRAEGSTFHPILNPPDGFVLEAGDRLALLARHFEDCEPDPATPPAATPRGHPPEPAQRRGAALRVLVLGWSHKAPPLVREFDGYESVTFQLDVLSLTPVAVREESLRRHEVEPAHLSLTQIVGDYTAPADLRRVRPESYDAIVMLGTDRLESDEEADARTVFGALLLREILGERKSPHVVVELLDPVNAMLLRKRQGEVIVTPLVLSHMLAQVVLRREMRALFDELFGPGGAEIAFHRATRYVNPDEPATFRNIQLAAAARGETALGVRTTAGPALHLNPSRRHTWSLTGDDDVVVLSEEGE